MVGIISHAAGTIGSTSGAGTGPIEYYVTVAEATNTNEIVGYLFRDNILDYGSISNDVFEGQNIVRIDCGDNGSARPDFRVTLSGVLSQNFFTTITVHHSGGTTDLNTASASSFNDGLSEGSSWSWGNGGHGGPLWADLNGDVGQTYQVEFTV